MQFQEGGSRLQIFRKNLLEADFEIEIDLQGQYIEAVTHSHGIPARAIVFHHQENSTDVNQKLRAFGQGSCLGWRVWRGWGFTTPHF